VSSSDSITPLSKLPNFDPRQIPVVGVDTHLPAVPREQLQPEALRQRFVAPPSWQPEVRMEPRFTQRAPVPASVLVPIVAHERPTVLLTQRTSHLANHSGQIAFPGGKVDDTDADSIAAALREAGVETRCVPAVRDTLWTKILANLTSNPLSVISGATLDAIYSDARLLPIVRQMLQEGLALAAAYGARITFDPISFIAEGAALGAVRTSMLQDYLAGRSLELAAIGDAVLELAQMQGIAMPVTERVIGLAHFREEAVFTGKRKDAIP